MSGMSAASRDSAARAKSLYFLTWRWHFYAGLFVVPFILILAVTGMVMMFDGEIEQARYSDILEVMPQHHQVAVSQQLAAVQSAYPHGVVTEFIPAQAADVANKFSVRMADGSDLFITVNPYSGEVLGSIDRTQSWYQLANGIHATLLIGDSGDYLLEIAASLGILLLVTGLYLWWPRDNASRAGFLKIRFSAGSRIMMRDLHANLGGVLSVVLLFFLISGLSWTGFWGKTFVQTWNSFPTYYTYGEKPQSKLMTHASLNHGTEKELPWNLELTPMPESTQPVMKEQQMAVAAGAPSMAGAQPEEEHDHSKMGMGEVHAMGKGALDIDTIIEKAHQMGFGYFRVFFPTGKTGVYTVTANTMAGDIHDPRDDQTVHFDQYSGELLMGVTWQDYTLFAKAMAAGVSLHQGDLSPVNKWLNVLFCVSFILIALTGVVMWWIRRPAGKGKLGVPPRFEQAGIWKVGLVTLILIGVAFPLAGLSIISVLLLDWLLFSRVARLRYLLS